MAGNPMKNTLKKWGCFCFILLLAAPLFGCQAPKTTSPVTRTSFLLNTVVTVTIYDSQDEALLDACMELCAHYETLFSRTLGTSELALLNEDAKKEANAGKPLSLSEELSVLTEKGLEYSRLAEGAFDITVEPVSSLWDFSSGEAIVPSRASIQAVLPLVGYQKLQLGQQSVSFSRAGMGLDLGAVAKGYIADRIRDYLVSQGVQSAMVNLGGNVVCIGSKPGGVPFRIGIQKPFSGRNETIAYMELSDISVVTSGVYERCFEADGQFYHHLLNPKTGYPYENHLISVTILSPYSVDGDGLSTACFALGLDRGMELIDSMEGVYGIFITDDYEIYYTEGFHEHISVVEAP